MDRADRIPFRLNRLDAGRLALYTARGEKVVIVAAIARPGQEHALARAILSLGGRIDHRLDSVGYVAAVLPIGSFARFIRTPALEAVSLDGLNDLDPEQLIWLSAQSGRSPRGLASAGEDDGSSPAPPPPGHEPKLPPRPLEMAHDIAEDMDVVPFRRENPRAPDGRGVVIAHVEAFPDFLSPELQTALDASGKPVRKFLDVIDVPAVAPSLDPSAEPRGDGWTTRLGPPLRSANGYVSWAGRQFRVPAPGSYRLAQLPVKAERVKRLLPALAPRTGESVRLDVLWSDRLGEAWIDTNANGDFSDEQGVREYRLAGRFGTLGKDDPATEVRESLGYAIERHGDYLAVNIGMASHCTMVDGAAAANPGASGRVSGVAPGAQIISISAFAHQSTTAFTRALVTAFTDKRADLVLVEGDSKLLVPADANDGTSLVAILLRRLAAHYGKPAFVTAFNDPRMSTVMDFAVPPNVLAVGAADTSGSLFANFGMKVRHPVGLHFVGAEGPAGDGSLKPDLLAPATSLSIAPRDQWSPREGLFPGVFQLPPGYQICSGTSCATPIAAGAAALLVGAAKQRGIGLTPERLLGALRAGARFIVDLPAYSQGYGLLQIGSTWNLLAQGIAPADEVQVGAPVRTASSNELMTADVGSGLFEREGWRPGDRRTRHVRLTRTSGPAGQVPYRLEWEGNDGTFSSAGTIDLPLGRGVDLAVDIHAATAGAHSALLKLERAGRMPTVVPVTIVAAEDLDAAHAFTWSRDVKLERPGRASLFVRVPEGASALSVSMKTPRPGIRLTLADPQRPGNFHITTTGEPKGAPARLTVERPVPGVWEIALQDADDRMNPDWTAMQAPYLPATGVSLTASLYQVQASLQGEEVKATNRLAPLTTGLVTTPLAALRQSAVDVGPGDAAVTDIDIREGQPLLLVDLEGQTASRGDLDLHLFDCTRGPCELARRGDQIGSDERLRVEDPHPGLWRAVVVGTGFGSARMAGRLNVLIADPRLGSFVTNDVKADRRIGDSWRSCFAVAELGPARADRLALVLRSPLADARLMTMDAFLPINTMPRFTTDAAALLDYLLLATVDRPERPGRACGTG